VDSLFVAGIVFASALAGAGLGMWLRTVLPEPHLSSDSRDVVKLATGLVATLTALVLGLLIASAKSSFDAQKTGFQQFAANFVVIDRMLAQYGPEAKPTRELLHSTVTALTERLWPKDGSRASGLDATEITELGGTLLNAIRALSPKTEVQRSLQSQMLQVGTDLGRLRWQLSQQEESSIPTPFLAVLIFWLFVLFVSFGLGSPRNATVFTAHLICALSVAGAVFLILDLSQPFHGLFQIPDTSFRKALAQMGQ
jgi:hypothetical protein